MRQLVPSPIQTSILSCRQAARISSAAAAGIPAAAGLPATGLPASTGLPAAAATAGPFASKTPVEQHMHSVRVPYVRSRASFGHSRYCFTYWVDGRIAASSYIDRLSMSSSHTVQCCPHTLQSQTDPLSAQQRWAMFSTELCNVCSMASSRCSPCTFSSSLSAKTKAEAPTASWHVSRPSLPVSSKCISACRDPCFLPCV